MASAIQLVGFVTCAFLLLALALSVTALGLPQWTTATSLTGWHSYGLFQYCTSDLLLKDAGCRGQHETARSDWLYGASALVLLCSLCNLIALILALVSATCKQNKKILFASCVPAVVAAICAAIACGIWADNHLDMVDASPGTQVAWGVALWLAVASVGASIISTIIPLIPVCVDHDAMGQTLPSIGTLKPSQPPQYSVNGIDPLDATFRRGEVFSYSDSGYSNDGYNSYANNTGYHTKPKYIIREEPRYIIREEPRYDDIREEHPAKHYASLQSEPRYLRYGEAPRYAPNYTSHSEPRYVPNGYRRDRYKEPEPRPYYVPMDDGYIAPPRQVVFVDR